MEIANMTIEELRARAAEIRTAVNAPDADLDALESEATEISTRITQHEQEQRRKGIADKVASGDGRTVRTFENEPRAYGVDSAEYRSAFLKNLLEIDMNREERAAFTHTTGNTTAPLPTTMLNQIWDLVSKQHTIMGDITVYRTGTILEVVKHTAIAQGKAKKVAEATANDDEQNTFVKVTLSGNDFSKHVNISYAQAKMGIDALESYLTNEIAAQLGEAMADDVIATITGAGGIATANKITTASATAMTYAEIVKTFGSLARVGAVTVYATRATIYNYLVAMTDTTGRPLFQPSLQAGQEGSLIGAAIKVEDSVPDGVLLIGDPSKVVYNMVQDIMIESDKDITKHTYVYSGYARGEGALIDDKAFASLTLKTA